jgi:hypothetical protein
MNAVKNCLVVLAAAVALASCSADPNSSSAGKATLTVTPGSVALRANTTSEVFASAVDPLGGAVSGSYTITNPTPALFTAVIDTAYTPVIGGSNLSTRTRIVVTALKSGDGSFTITGTGGSKTIGVRIAPDSLNGDMTLSKSTLAEIDTFTVTLNPGVRFTSGTTVGIYHQAGPADSALFSPVLVGISSDSQTATVAVGPNSGGQVRFDGLANTSTPTITYAARAATIISSPTLDTTGTDSTTAQVANVRVSSIQPIVNDTLRPAIGDTITATAPAGWRFTPATTVHLYKGPTVNDSTDGVAQPHFVSLSPDSSTLKFIPAPDGKGQARFTHMVLTSHPAQYTYAAVRSLEKIVVPHLAFAPTFARADSNPNTVVTITMPAGVKLVPTTGLSATGFLAPIILTRAADSNSMTVKLPPALAKTAMSFAHVRATAVPFFDLTLPTDNTVTTLAASDQGGDDPAGSIPTINLPALGNYGLWDVGSFSVEDQSPDAGGPGINSQVYKYVLGVNATIISDVQWSVGRDVDAMLLDYGATTNQAAYGPGGGFSGATATAFHEIQNSGALTAGNYMLDLIDWGPAYPDTPAVGATIRIAITVQ